MYDGSASGALYLDTPRVITDTQGNKVWEWQNSDPFGNNIPNENPSGLGTFVYNQRFAGQYFDKETGLHQNHFRDYDPANGGRYIESDPIGLDGGSFSTYTYAASNPLRFVDPSGLALADYGGWGFPTEKEHFNRNKHNYCPKKEPKQCKDFNKDPEKYSNKYRDSSGDECAYDANGNLLPDTTAANGEQNYSYNYAPGGGSFFGELFSLRHYIQDVAPHYYYTNKGQYPSNLTNSGKSCECQ